MSRRKTKSMACYVRIRESVDTDELIEIPTEDDGTLMLSSVSAQFPGAVGLRFKTDSGSWRGVRLVGNIINPPMEGWEDTEYFVVIKKDLKHGSEINGVDSMGNKMTRGDILSDLMVANLPYSATDAEVRNHFEGFGDLDMFNIKYDNNGKSRGFGFIRYKTIESVEAALSGTHIIKNRRCELRYSRRSQDQQQGEDNIRTKLFVGRLPSGTTTMDLQEHFSAYGVLKDVYIPTPFRGFGFVTYGSQTVANKVLRETHEIKGAFLNVTNPTEKRMDGMFGQPNPGFGNIQGSGFDNMQKGMQMGNRLNKMSGGSNTQPWMQGKMQNKMSGDVNTQPKRQEKMVNNTSGLLSHYLKSQALMSKQTYGR